MKIARGLKSLVCLFVTALMLCTAGIYCLSGAVSAFAGDESSSGGDEATAEGVTRYASVLNLDDAGNFLGGSANDNFYNNLQGKQQDYIYYGTNLSTNTKHSGAILWRVLSKNDKRYATQDGSLLLWADYQLGTSSWNGLTYSSSNLYYNNPNYAFWGTSYMRAMLNGGTYVGKQTDGTNDFTDTWGTVTDANSYYQQLFSPNERKSVVSTTSYTTDYRDTYYSNSADNNQRRQLTTNDITTSNSSGNYGYYRNATLSNKSAGSVVYNENRVIEQTTDNMFLLDYYDINNTEYGFGDDGVVYADKVINNYDTTSTTTIKSYKESTISSSSSYSSASDAYAKEVLAMYDADQVLDTYSKTNLLGYPWYYYSTTTTQGASNGITSSYLTVSDDLSAYYWLRAAGRTNSYPSIALVAGSSGFVRNYAVSYSYGVRPAFNFNLKSVIYATAGAVADVTDTVKSVSEPETSGTYAYKIYQRAEGFTNYNEEAKADQPQLKISANNIVVSLPNKTGKAIVLLSDKTNSKVAYMAQADFTGGENSTATVKLGGVKAGGYTVSVLFADSLNGGNYSEQVTGSYVEQGYAIPTDYTYTYTGTGFTVADFGVASWYNEDLYPADKGKMTVKFEQDGKEVVPTDAGVYDVTFAFKQGLGLTWDDGTTEAKTIKLTIKPKPVDISVTTDSSGMPTGAMVDVDELENKDVSSPPSVVFYYTNKDGTVAYSSTDPPTHAGSYTITFQMEDTSGNYTLSTKAEAISYDYVIEPTKIAVPTIANSVGSYTSVEQYFTLSGWDSTAVDVITPDGVTFDSSTLKFTVVNANESGYTITYRLKNTSGYIDYVWSDDESYTAKTGTIKITQKALSAEFVGDIDWEWASNAEKDIVVSNDSFSGDNVDLKFTLVYMDGTDKGKEVNLTSITNDYDNKQTTITIPDLPKGSYKLVVGLGTATDTNANANYSMTEISHTFETLPPTPNVTAVTWKYKSGNSSEKTVTGDTNPFEVFYNKNTYTFSVDENALQSQGVKVKEISGTQSASDVGEYTVTVSVVNLDDWATYSNTFSLKWKISTGKLDLSNLSWDYSTPFTFDGSTKSVTLSGIDESLMEVSYKTDGNESGASSVGTHTTTVVITPKDKTNYMTPSSSDESTYINTGSTFTWTVTWSIQKQSIAIVWSGSLSYKDSTSGISFDVPQMSSDSAKVSYVYTYYKAVDDGDSGLTQGDEITLDEIEYVSGTKQAFYAKVALESNYTGTYQLTGNEYELFYVGDSKKSVELSVSTSAEHDGTQKQAVIKVTSSDCSLDYLDIVYFDTATGTKFDSGTYPTNLGTYTIEISVKTAYADTYSLSGATDGVLSYTFTITKKQVSLENVTWQYKHDNLTTTVAGDVSPFVVYYDGLEYTFNIAYTADELASFGVKISGDYSGDVTASAVSTNDYKASVTLVNIDDTWESFTKTYTITWKVDKGKLDLSGLSWDYTTPFVYDATDKSVNLIDWDSSLMTVTYTTDGVADDNSASTVGKHTTTVTITPKDTDNYKTPSASVSDSYIDANGSMVWTIEWEIQKATITISWGNKKYTNSSGSFEVPELNTDSNKVNYTYYKAVEDSTGSLTKGDAIELADITYISGTLQKFYAEIALKDSFVSSYQFDSTDTIKLFAVGSKQGAVIVSVSSGETYDGTQKQAEITIVNSAYTTCTVDYFDVAYYKGDVKLDDGVYPVNAGTYKITIAVKSAYSGNYFIEGDSEFEFVVAKQQLDLSSVVWNYTEAFMYELDGGVARSYSVALTCFTGNATYVESVLKYTQDSTLSASSAKVYTATYDLSGIDYDNYVIVAQPTAEKTLTWQIKPHQIIKPAQVIDDIVFDDLSHDLITLSNMPEDWSSYATVKVYKDGTEFADGTNAYNIGAYTLIFTLIDSDSCEWIDSKGRSESLPYSIYCDIVPKVLVVEGWYSKPGKPQFTEVVADKYYELVYTNEAGDVVSVSDATSTYNTTFTVTIKPASSMGDNVQVSAVDGVALYEEFMCFDTLVSKPTKLTKPALTKTEIEYTGYDIDIVDYLDSNYKSELMKVAGDLSVVVVGDSYTIYISILGSVNATWGDDTTDTLVLTYSIVKAKLSTDFEKGQRVPSLAEAESLVEYKYYDENGKVIAEADLVQGVQYYITAEIKDEYKDSYGFGDDGESETEKVAFKVTPPVAVAIPTIDKYSYEFNSAEQTFKLKGVDSAYVEYNASELTQTNANTYYVTVRIKSGEYAVWDDEEGGSDERQVEFVITKKTIEVDWDMTTSLPFLNLHGVVPNTGVTYKYYDSDGNQVANNALKNGEEYTIKGILADEYAVNYMFDKTLSSISSGQSFTYVSDDVSTVSGNGTGDIGSSGTTGISIPEDFPLWQVIVGSISFVVGFIAYVKAGENNRVARRLKRKNRD